MKQNTEQKDAWKRQPGESMRAYEAFSMYRDLGAARSLRVVGQRLGKSDTLLSKWSSRWNWVERARTWDNELAQEAKNYAAKQIKDMLDRHIKDMLDRHIKVAMQLQRRALEALAALDSERLSPKDVLVFIQQATELERLNRMAKKELCRPFSPEKDDIDSTCNLLDYLTRAYMRRTQNE